MKRKRATSKTTRAKAKPRKTVRRRKAFKLTGEVKTLM